MDSSTIHPGREYLDAKKKLTPNIKMAKIYTLKCDSTKIQKSRFQVFKPFCDSSCNQLFCKSFAEGRDVLNSHQQHNKHQNDNVLYKKFSGNFFPKNISKDVLWQQQRTKSLSSGLSPSFPATHVGFGGCACGT